MQPPLDLDDTDLTVRIYRNGGTTPIAQIPVHVLFWRKPTVNFVDDTLAAGARPTYTADAIDNSNLVSPKSPASAAVTVGSTTPVRNSGQRRQPVVLLAAQRSCRGPRVR